MKKYIIVICALVMVLASCKKGGSFLDQTATQNLSTQAVFSDSAHTFQFLSAMYEYIGQDIIPQRAAFFTSGSGNEYASLEDLTTYSKSYYSAPGVAWLTGLATSTSNPFIYYYTQFYTEIRACNQYMQNVPSGPLSDSIKKRTIAEARFLRAFFYAQMIRLFGGVMLVGDQPLPATFSTADYKRNTYKECVDYIVAQCDTAAMNLPSSLTQNASDYGRATLGACLALKARVLLTAASPLFNGSPSSTAANVVPLICYSASYDASLWQKAITAFQAVMNLNQYSLYVDNSILGNGFRQLFLMRQNSEFIMPYMVPPSQSSSLNSNGLELLRFPISRGGYGQSNPSQNLVDQFGMNNGLPITNPSSGYDSTNPYVNRDPRFYHTIIFNGASVYLSSSQKMAPVNIYDTKSSTGVLTPTTDGIASYVTFTGYYCSKMANDSVATSTAASRVLPLMRYAEILLGFAEASNEYNGPTTDVYNAVKQIRIRAGIAPGANGNYGLAPGMTKAQMRTIIQNEYQVEFAYEGHWFYDSRRWRIAETQEAIPMTGLLAVIQSNNSFVYSRFNVLATIWGTQMYFAPIPATEIYKSTLMVQNPGW